VDFLTTPEVFLSAVDEQQTGQRQMVKHAGEAIKRLKRRLAHIQEAEARAYSGYVRGDATEETYKRVAAELRAERAWVTEELERQHMALERAEEEAINAEAVKVMYPLLLERIAALCPAPG